MIQYAEPVEPGKDVEARAREIADREQFIIDSIEVVDHPPNGWEAALLITGHQESCMWCGSVIRPGRTHCPSCAAKVGMASFSG